ncbi:lysylphosphatidylglycerol synthase transmembrane domain-containing protein [Haloferax sp. YSSS75]|uniref:lysylphosphatidylglycerol synthase transmembrane domain-containing protein n=1 Tax=Haloferax sp. YSSS75 TaxID=3388564 RepID=UPI00398CD0A3
MTHSTVRTRDVWRTAAGVVLALTGFAIYVWFVGVTDVVDAVRSVSPRDIASLVVLGLLPIVVWGAGLWLLLHRIGARVGLWDATVLFAATGFVNAVTPFGQSGGTPVSSLLVAWEADIDYESAFAAVASLNVLVRLASLSLAFLAVVVYASRLVPVGQNRSTATIIVGVTLTFLVVGGVLWVARHDVAPVAGRALGRLTARVGHWIPGVTPPSPASVVNRVERFVATLDVLASDPWRLVAVFALATFGQVSVAAALWTALDTLGVDQPLLAVFLVVPLAKVSGVVPTPGGLGSAEVVLSGLLAAMLGVPTASATAAALVYRGTVYWVPTALGAVATGGLLFSASGGTETRRTRQMTAVAFALAGGISILFVVVIHTRALFTEPTEVVVHLVRDVGLGVLGFTVLWALFTTATKQ